MRKARVLANRQANQIARQLNRFLDQTTVRGIRPSLEDVIAPPVNFALQVLRRTVPAAARRLLAREAWRSLHRHLASRLAFALTPTLRLERNATEAVARSFEKKQSISQVSLRETFHHFPGAFETASRIIANWIEAQEELLSRLFRDRRIVRSSFFGSAKRFRVVGIKPGLSDSHHGGRTVTLIEFVEQRRLIYKPRSSSGEQLWFGALGLLDRNGVQASPRRPELLSRKNYYWMEFLGTRSCRNLSDVRHFYFRWGAQAALAQVLSASDLHRENWLAVRSQPVLVDFELIGHPRTRPQGANKKMSDRQSLLPLLETGLLPLTSRDRAGRYRGIAPFDANLSGVASPDCWPKYREIFQPPWKFVNDLVNGFEASARIFSKPGFAREFFRKVISRLAHDSNVRVFFRPSAEYARILRESIEPSKMISAGSRRRWLAQKCCATSFNQSVGRAEARALLHCDLPRFVARRGNNQVSWKQFSAALAQLKRSPRLLRRRVLLGKRVHWRQTTKR